MLTAGTHRRKILLVGVRERVDGDGERDEAGTDDADPARMAGVEPVVDTLASDQCGQTCES